MKKHYFIFVTLSLIVLASCAVQNPMVTDATYETFSEVNCKSEYEQIYVFYEKPSFQYVEIGRMTITSSSVNTDYLAENHKQESMLNMAKYVAWMNCADGVMDIQQYRDSVTAMAIYFDITPRFAYQIAENLETGFVDYINQEMENNEIVQNERREWNDEMTKLLIEVTMLVFTLLVMQ